MNDEDEWDDEDICEDCGWELCPNCGGCDTCGDCDCDGEE